MLFYLLSRENNFEDQVSNISEDISTLINTILKQMVSIFAKKNTYLEVVTREYSANLAILTFKCIVNPNIQYEIKAKSALIFVHSLNVIPQQYCKHLVSCKRFC